MSASTIIALINVKTRTQGPFSLFRCGGQAGSWSLHRGARLGPGRTSWRVLWASRVARAGSFLRDCVPRRVAKEYGTHTCCFWLCSKQCCLCTSHSLLSVFLPLWKPYTEPLYNSSCVSSFLLLDSYGTRYMYAPWLLSFYVPAQIPQ